MALCVCVFTDRLRKSIQRDFQLSNLVGYGYGLGLGFGVWLGFRLGFRLGLELVQGLGLG